MSKCEANGLVNKCEANYFSEQVQLCEHKCKANGFVNKYVANGFVNKCEVNSSRSVNKCEAYTVRPMAL